MHSGGKRKITKQDREKIEKRVREVPETSIKQVQHRSLTRDRQDGVSGDRAKVHEGVQQTLQKQLLRVVADSKAQGKLDPANTQANFLRRLDLCIAQKGGRFERLPKQNQRQNSDKICIVAASKMPILLPAYKRRCCENQPAKVVSIFRRPPLSPSLT